MTGAALAFGVPLGLVLALMRLSPRRLLAWPAGVVIDVFRTTPPLVQLFWFLFALPLLLHVQSPPVLPAVLPFSIPSAAFFAGASPRGTASWGRARAFAGWQGLSAGRSA